MGAVRASLWIHYHMRLFEPWWYGTPEMAEEVLSLFEKNGEENKSFRGYVIGFVNTCKDLDNFYIPDKRINDFVDKNFAAKTSIYSLKSMQDWNDFVRQRSFPEGVEEQVIKTKYSTTWLPSGRQETLEEFKVNILREFEEWKAK